MNLLAKPLFFLSISLILFGCEFTKTSNQLSDLPDGESQYEPYAPDGIPFKIVDTPWIADMQGNHRAVVSVLDNSKAVLAELPWRRPDLRPGTKKIVVVDATTNKEIKNVSVRKLSNESGTIVFEPVTVPGEYYIYYMPYKFRKGHGDARYGDSWNDYLPAEYDANKEWVNSLTTDYLELQDAKVLRFESRSRFDSFTPMGCIATQREMDDLKNQFTENPIVFTEDRAFPIRLTKQIPARWVENGPSNHFSGEAMKNEYYVWQLGVWAAHKELKNVRLLFSDFVSGADEISKDEVTCFNQEGINWDGQPITFEVDVPKGEIQALWCGVQIPKKFRAGTYRGTATLTADGINPRDIDVEIKLVNQVLVDKGDGDLWRHARLRWLNSTIGQSNDPIDPFQSMSVNGNEVKATEKSVSIDKSGLPKAIKINNREVLSDKISFIVETESGDVVFDASNLIMQQEADGLVKWNSSSVQNGIAFDCSAYMEFDGYIRYNLKVSSSTEMPVKDIRLVTHYTPYSSEYFMGAGFKGGFRPTEYDWDWTGPYDSYWMGNAKAGLHVEYRGGEYHGPLLNDYKPEPPHVWSNSGKGTVSIEGKKGASATVTARTGKNVISSDVKDFEFALIITPVKPVNTAKHFSERYYHANPTGFNKAAEGGANVANIHHAQKLNPMINYPFIVRNPLIDFISEQHKHDRKVKLYYTIRELTNYTTEIFALHSLNNEILENGVGYGLPWHTEHLIDNYKPAWYTEMPDETSDAALVLTGFSRWINYYLEGARWMFENYKIDGIYMDDVAFDRSVMKRMRRIFQAHRPNAIIDLHSNTWYSVGPANQYTDYFAYIDRLWFGESFQYNKMMPDEWFVTFSGIPFGQMSEMLQDGGNKFLGMVYGTTGRHSYYESSPTPVWDLWESFGIEDAKMVGYWDEDAPVSTNYDNVKATSYVKSDKVLISIGNFDDIERSVRLDIDWDALDIDPQNATLVAPEVKDFQKTSSYDIKNEILIKSKEGLLLILHKK